MREILFRGKRTDNGEWVEGYYIHRPTAVCIGESNPSCIWVPAADPDDNTKIFEVFSETVGQFTGLYDKNGRKIFEGDIVVFADFFDDKIHRGVVYWCDLAFWFDCTETEGDEGMYSLAYISVNVLEVIGNTYDNPELLKGGNKNV